MGGTLGNCIMGRQNMVYSKGGDVIWFRLIQEKGVLGRSGEQKYEEEEDLEKPRETRLMGRTH